MFPLRALNESPAHYQTSPDSLFILGLLAGRQRDHVHRVGVFAYGKKVLGHTFTTSEAKV